MGTTYYYTPLNKNGHEALVVLDQDAVLVYVALGSWHSSVSLMKREFRKITPSPKPLGDKANKEPFKEALEVLTTLFCTLNSVDEWKKKVKHRYIFGTELQQRVWRHLEALPEGTTTTYTEVAEKLGMRPQMARVVANAVGANKLAVVVPCHRVLHRDWSLSGFKWGKQMKWDLLCREGVFIGMRPEKAVKSKLTKEQKDEIEALSKALGATEEEIRKSIAFYC